MSLPLHTAWANISIRLDPRGQKLKCLEVQPQCDECSGQREAWRTSGAWKQALGPLAAWLWESLPGWNVKIAAPTPCEGSLFSHTSAEHVDRQENTATEPNPGALPMNGI